MSHYTIDYASLSGDAKRRQAVRDIREYLGVEHFVNLHTQIVAAVRLGATADDLAFSLAFAGVQGYTVRAWVDTAVIQILWRRDGKA